MTIEGSENAGSCWELNPGHLSWAASTLRLSYNRMTTSYSPHSPLFPTWGKFKYRSSVITECRNMVWIFNLLCHSWQTYGDINMHVLICIICFHVRVAIVVLCCQAVYLLQLIDSFFSQETKLNAQELFIYTKAWSKISYRWVIGKTIQQREHMYMIWIYVQ